MCEGGGGEGGGRGRGISIKIQWLVFFLGVVLNLSGL